MPHRERDEIIVSGPLPVVSSMSIRHNSLHSEDERSIRCGSKCTIYAIGINKSNKLLRFWHASNARTDSQTDHLL